MSLILHAGAEPVDFDALRALPIPQATPTHHPIPHHRIVEMLRHSLTFYGHEVTEEQFGVTKDGARFFGVMMLKSEYGDYTDTVGLRNSHDKSFPVGVSYGSRVFVCDNLSFAGDHVIKRKHTAKALRDIHALMADLIEPLSTQRWQQHQTFEKYKETLLPELFAHHAIIQLYKDGVLNQQRIPEVLAAYEKPPHDWGDETAWRLFNCVTHSLTGKVAEAPHLTRQLHRTLDGVCRRLH